MVNVSRIARNSKGKADDGRSNKKVNSVENSPVQADASGVRRSASSSRQTTPTPRKSKRLEKGTPPLTTPVKRMSKRVEKYDTPSPLRRSDRAKNNLSSISSDSKQSSEESLSELKRKKEKSLSELTLDSEKAEVGGKKRKKMNGRNFQALLKKQRIKEIVPDGHGELEGRDKLSEVRSDNGRGINSEPTENGCTRVVEKLSNFSIGKADDETLQKSVCSLKSSPDMNNDVNLDSSHRDNVVDEPCSAIAHIDVPRAENSNCLARSQDGSLSSDSSAETTSPLSSKYETFNLMGTCVLCSKYKRVGYNSPEKELCSCNPTVDEGLGSFSTCKDRSDHGAAFTSESAEKHDSRLPTIEKRADSQIDGHENVCALCNKDGELLLCQGKGCKGCYHPSCLDFPLSDTPPGVWHCPQCVKKKLLFGVHSVSEGVESILDVREVEVSNAKGVRQRQYLVKYHGLAHIHNHWVPKNQLFLENPSLSSHFIENDQIVRWNAAWTLPHRLLRKRPVQDKIYIASSAGILVIDYEWLVKWQGLGYDHATWELENADFLSSSLGQKLMKDYEIRRQKAKQEVSKHHKGSIVKLSELPASQSLENDNYLLEHVNKLRECMSKCQNAVIVDDQEGAITVLFSILSMSDICQPFLIVTASSSLSYWETEFARLVSSVDVVVYSGNNDTRRGVRASEFYDEEGRVMLQVLLSSAEAVFEDLDTLSSIKWEAIVIDGHQHSGISHDLEQIKRLTTDSRILLVSGQLKDTTSEYLKILSLLESDGGSDKLRGLKSETNDNLHKLKDRLSRFIAYGSTSQLPKFLEYWVPVQISNLQLEHYCATLLSNSAPLRSCSRSDPVGAHRDILSTVRKCCDHPYLLDLSLQDQLIAEQCPAAEILDTGIKVSGKLQLLDTMLAEIKARGLQVLILFQLIKGPGEASTGNILDDFVRQRFGPNSFERVDTGIIPSKKHAACNRFNKKETGQFVFLLENRACSSVIKLSSLDIIVIYDSDWNPAQDLRTLQKISIDSKVEQIKVFRLYSSFTVEERALILAKQNLNLDNNLQTHSRTPSDTLLSWGATHLFSKLEEYHADKISTPALDCTSGELLLNQVIKEFQAILSESSENTYSNSVISKVKLGVGSYSMNIPLLGEPKVQLKDGEEPHVFWRNLLDGKNPQWKHLKGPCSPSPRNRKRVNYLDGTPSKPETEKDAVVKKRKKMVTENVAPTVAEADLRAHEVTEAVPKGGSSTTIACNQDQNLQGGNITSNNSLDCTSGWSSHGAEVSPRLSDAPVISSDEQKGPHSSLQGELTRLCQILKLSEEVTHTVRRFLEYVIKNHHVNSDSPFIVQAFQISLCWVAASITKQKVDKKESLMLAKQLLNYQCTEEQANSVYSKMRSLKRMYLQCSENTTESVRDSLVADEDFNKGPSNVNQEGGSVASSDNQSNLSMERADKSANEAHAGNKILSQQEPIVTDIAALSETDKKIKKIQKKCDKWMKKLTRKHEKEILEFQKTWEEKRQKLETDHKLESAFIRSIHGQGSVRADKLKLLELNFAKKMEEHNLLKDSQLKDLEAEQSAAVNEERKKGAQWLATVKEACSSELRAVNGPQTIGPIEDDVAGLKPSNIIGSENSGQQLEDQNPSNIIGTIGNGMTHSITSVNPSAETINCETPPELLVTGSSQNEMGVISAGKSTLPVVDHRNQSKHSSENGETAVANLPSPPEQVSAEIQSVDQNETVPDEDVGHVQPEECNASMENPDEASKIASPNALVSQRDQPDGAASGSSRSPVQPQVLSEQVQQDTVDHSLVSPERQDVETRVQNDQIASQVENTITSGPSDHEAPVVNEAIIDVYPNPNLEAQADALISRNQTSPTEGHDQERSLAQTAQHGDKEVISQESVSRSWENSEVHSDHLDIGSVSAAARGGVSLSAASQNDVAISQAVVSTAEQPDQDILQLGLDAGPLNGSNNLLSPPTHQPTSWNSSSLLLADPLGNELQRMRKESEQLEKDHEDMKSKLKLDREKEILEMMAQIHKKYESKLQETEADFKSKRNELERNQNKVLMNKILAEAFRSKCLDPRPSRLPGVPASFTHHLLQQLSTPSMGPSPVAASQQITTPSIQTMQLSTPQSARPSPVSASQQIPAPALQTTQQLQQLSTPPSATRSPGPASQQITTPALQTMQHQLQQLPTPPSARPSPGLASQQIQTPALKTVQQQQQLPTPPSARPYPVAAEQQIPTPALQTMHQQQFSRSSSVRPSTIPSPTTATRPPPPIQPLPSSSPLFSGRNSSRPPLISAITPSRNPRVSGEIRAPAPHLQPFRPPNPSPTSSPSLVNQLQPLQMPPPSQPILAAPPPWAP